MVLPCDFNEYSTKKYPTILRVYAGPSTQAVTDAWYLSNDKGVFDAYLATSRGYAVVYIDGRGSSGRGSKYLKPVYRNLGTIEIFDQINGFRKLLEEYSFLDANRTAVWGWSYGGFATGHIVEYDGFNVFKCAASIAPVTNYLYYDATYTERYMGLYPDNVKGYNGTNLMKNITAFQDKSYLIAHGTYDGTIIYL
ncbi:unnamed protein product [Soboliphyme baturini]|uniref:Peptidase_S9 domain-containing protein n=1 Tax=Soboliphyme baturini TaxID=241478 RepID=A0A183IWK5_9BILA|nr:unnamed protein product [Soboliphyme baturini]